MKSSFSETENLIREGLARLSIPFHDEEVAKLIRHIEEIELWNTRHNLVRASTNDLAVKHALDSLAGIPAIMELAVRSSIIDIGSGAGFPGIPLAIFLKDSAFTFVERMRKRAAFLTNAAILLGLKNVRVKSVDFATLETKYDIVTFRAVSALPPEIESFAKLLTREGIIAAYKGKKSNALAEIEELLSKGYEATLVPLSVPFLDEERNLIIVKSK
jgi:16S rRNA (guanine527-N7)-methyltransferase